MGFVSFALVITLWFLVAACPVVAFAPPQSVTAALASPSNSDMLKKRLYASTASQEQAATVNEASAEQEKNNKRRGIIRILTRVLVIVATYLVGFNLGKNQRQLSIRNVATVSKSRPVLSIVIIILLARDIWRSIPPWLKSKRRKGQLAADPSDLTDIGTIAMKLQSLFTTAETKLLGGRQIDVLSPTLALIQLELQLKERGEDERIQRYQKSGQKAGTRKDLEGLDEAFELADLAYDENPLGSLKEVLEDMGFRLLRHDTTTVPGYVGHYVAISKERNLVVIGVKGTSSFEDMVTDVCGVPITYQLQAPFVRHGKTEIQCHEGILISSLRLTDDLQPLIQEFILPSRYQILIVGHSLGAAAANMLALLLRSRIPKLAHDSRGTKMRVLAFASPPILDYDNAKACADFTTTIVNNSDMIPRASLSNLNIQLEILDNTNQKLIERGLDPSTHKNTRAFIQKLASGKEGDLLMNAGEYHEMIDRASAKVQINDPDHLFVPGRVLFLYNDKWKNGDQSGGIAVCDDGANEFLRIIELDERMIEDHLSESYRANIKSLLSPE